MNTGTKIKQPALIDIRNATLWRGTTCVFDSLSLRIEEGERVAIVGPNGSGKTTLLKTLNREIYPVEQEGSSIRILGKDRWNVWDLRKKIGVLSHDLHTRYPLKTTALDVVTSGFHSSIGVHGIVSAQVSERQIIAARQILESLDMQDFADTALRDMSTGQQRRCLLARALVHRPETLILDEPTAGLDFSASFDFMARVRRLAREGCNIILVTHYLNEIPPEIDRVVILKSGVVVADGCKNEVLTPSLLSEVYETDIRVRQVDGYFLAYPG